MQTNFTEFENIKRLQEWVEGLSEVYWDSIVRVSKNPKTKNKKNGKINVTGSTELIESVKKGDLIKSRSILESNPFAIGSVDVKNDNFSLAHIACKNKDLEMMKLLIEFKINIESEERHRMTPIYFAAAQNDLAMVEYLIKIGANLNHLDVRNRTPVYYVTELSEPKIIKALLDAGSDPSIVSKSGRTALSKAWWVGSTEVVKYLLETKKVKIDEPDHTGRTCLHHAVWGWSKIRENEELGEENQESLDIAKLLLEFGADPNFKDKSGSTPLSLACLNYRENCIKLLISYGGDINLANNNGETPFLCAVHKGYYECWLILYEQPDVNPYAKTIYGYDALELAIAHGRERLVSWVIKEKLENSKEYPGFELSKHDSKILLHHAVNNPKNNYQNIKTVFDYMYNYKYEELKSWFSDCFLRALLRNLDSAIKVFMSDEYSKLHSEIKFNEYILITSSFISSEVFSFVLERLDTDLPIVCLLVLIFYQSESLLSSLLLHPMLKFSTSDLSSPTDISFFMNYLTSDVLASYTYYPSLVHPFFSDESKVKFIR